MKSMTVRFSDRYEDIAAIHDALYAYNLSRTKLPRRADVHAEHFPEQYALLACDEDGVSRGGIAFHWENEPRRVFVDYFFLAEEVRGGGFGRIIFEEFIRRVKREGAVRIDLTTNTFQAPGFYRKMEFQVTGEEKMPSPGCPDNIHYALTLSL